MGGLTILLKEEESFKDMIFLAKWWLEYREMWEKFLHDIRIPFSIALVTS